MIQGQIGRNTQASVLESPVGWLLIPLSDIFYGFRVQIVYADAAYSDGRMFKVVHDILHAHPAIHYNLRCSGKHKLAVALAAQHYQRPDLLRRRSMVLAQL